MLLINFFIYLFMFFYSDNNNNTKHSLKYIIGSNFIKIIGPKGVLCKKKDKNIYIIQKINNFYFLLKNSKILNKKQKLYLLLIIKRFRKLILLVKYGFILKLRFVGIGYKMEYNKTINQLELKLGYSNSIFMEIPNYIDIYPVKTSKNLYVISSIYQNSVQNLAFKIKNLRKPEPYKGKGIRYQGEYVRRKEGKKNAN